VFIDATARGRVEEGVALMFRATGMTKRSFRLSLVHLTILRRSAAGRELRGGRRRGDTWDVHDHQRGAGGFHIERVSPGETPGFQFDLDFHVIGDDGTLLKSGCMTLTQK